MTDARMYHAIGYRDALAVLCAEARLRGPSAAVRKAAEQLIEIDPDHCHAKVVLEQSSGGQRDRRRKQWRRKRKKRNRKQEAQQVPGNKKGST